MAGDLYVEIAVETPVKTFAKTKGIAAHLRKRGRSRNATRIRRLLREGEGILEPVRRGLIRERNRFPFPIENLRP